MSARQYDNVSNNPRFGRPLIPYFMDDNNDHSADGPIINEDLTLTKEIKDYQREIVVPKGQDSIRVREFKDGYFEYKDIALDEISNFDNIMITEANPRPKPPKSLPTNLQVMHPIDGEPNSKYNSPGKRNKRRGGSTMSHREHFANYDKMVTNNPNNRESPSSALTQNEPVISDNFDTAEYQPSDSDVIKKLFPTHAPSPTIHASHTQYHHNFQPSLEPQKALLSPTFFMNNQPPRTHPPHSSAPTNNKPTTNIHDFIKSVERKAAPQIDYQPVMQPMFQPPHHHHPPPHFHPPSHAPMHPHQPHQPHVPMVHLNPINSTTPYLDDQYDSPRSSPAMNNIYTTPPHGGYHIKSSSISGGETIPNHSQNIHVTDGIRIVNNGTGSITTGMSPLTEAEILATLMPVDMQQSQNKTSDVDKKKTERYAGGMWTSSPPPSSLPVPKFKTIVKKCV